MSRLGGCGATRRLALGRSPTAKTYAISSLQEAHAYLEHPVLGPRLRECSATVAGLDCRDARRIFGNIDAHKLRSSMTLFAMAAPDEPLFGRVLDKYCDGTRDAATEARL